MTNSEREDIARRQAQLDGHDPALCRTAHICRVESGKVKYLAEINLQTGERKEYHNRKIRYAY